MLAENTAGLSVCLEDNYGGESYKVPRYDSLPPPFTTSVNLSVRLRRRNILATSNSNSFSEGEWLRQQRKRHGWHQHQLAAKLDLNQGRISEWEHGKPIPIKWLAQLRRILN